MYGYMLKVYKATEPAHIEQEADVDEKAIHQRLPSSLPLFTDMHVS